MNLNQITVPSLDLKESIPFYESLGLTLIVISLPHYARFICPDGNSTFSIQQTNQLPKGDGIHFYFECNELDKTVKLLEDKGLIFDEQPTDKPWLWREAKLKDPDGNQIVLYHAGDHRINPPWRLPSSK